MAQPAAEGQRTSGVATPSGRCWRRRRRRRHGRRDVCAGPLCCNKATWPCAGRNSEYTALFAHARACLFPCTRTACLAGEQRQERREQQMPHGEGVRERRLRCWARRSESAPLSCAGVQQLSKNAHRANEAREAAQALRESRQPSLVTPTPGTLRPARWEASSTPVRSWAAQLARLPQAG